MLRVFLVCFLAAIAVELIALLGLAATRRYAAWKHRRRQKVRGELLTWLAQVAYGIKRKPFESDRALRKRMNQRAKALSSDFDRKD